MTDGLLFVHHKPAVRTTGNHKMPCFDSALKYHNLYGPTMITLCKEIRDYFMSYAMGSRTEQRSYNSVCRQHFVCG